MPVRRHRWVALAAASALVLAGCSSSDDEPNADSPSSSAGQSPTESPSQSPDDSRDPSDPGRALAEFDEENSPTLAPRDVPDGVAKAAEKATTDFLDRVGEELEEPNAKKQLKTVPGVTGPALDELRNRVAEYDSSGWRVLGEPVIVSQRVVQLLEDPEQAVVDACIDNSAVRVVDPDGKRVPNSKPAEPRTRNIITLVKTKKGAWIVADQRPAAKPDC